jgi:hypothetical protein
MKQAVRHHDGCDPSSATMTCAEIRIGMIFHVGEAPNQVFEVVDHGNYYMKDGKRIEVENNNRSKWNCRPLGTDEEPKLFCFDQIFLKSLYNFRMP